MRVTFSEEHQGSKQRATEFLAEYDYERDVPAEFVERILEAHPSVTKRKLDPQIAMEILKREFGLPCFTWKLGAHSKEPLHILADRVGGNTDFATCSDTASEWPCGETMFFFCQVNLVKISKKLASTCGPRWLVVPSSPIRPSFPLILPTSTESLASLSRR